MSALGNLPRNFYALKAEATLTALGSITPASAMRLRHIRPTIFKTGTRAGSERMRLKIFPTSAMTTAMHTSDWVTLAAVEAALEAQIGSAIALTDSYYAHVRFDFSQPHLHATAYYVGIELENYTPVGDTFFVGVKTDWPDVLYSGVNANDYLAAQLPLLGYT